MKMQIERDTCFCIIDLINKIYIRKCRIHFNSRNVKDCRAHNKIHQNKTEAQKNTIREATKPL